MGGVTSEDVDEIPYIEISFKIPSCYVSLLKRGGPKCATLYGFRSLYLKHMGRRNGTMHKSNENSSKVGTSFNLDQLVDKSLKSKSVGNYKRNQKCFWQFLWPILTKHLPTNQTHALLNLPTLFKCIVLTVIQLYVDVKQHTHRNTLTEV